MLGITKTIQIIHWESNSLPPRIQSMIASYIIYLKALSYITCRYYISTSIYTYILIVPTLHCGQSEIDD